MAKQSSQTSKGRRFHLEVANLHTFIFECLNLLILLWVSNISTQLTSLRTIETTTSHRVALNHIVASHLFYQVGISYSHIRCALDGIPLHMLTESLLHRYITHHVTSCIVVQQAIKADALHGGHKTARWRERLQTATGTDAYHRECAMLVFLHTRGIVDISQRIKLVDHDINIITTYAVTLNGDALALIGTGNSMELTTAYLVLYRIEMSRNSIYSGWVAH